MVAPSMVFDSNSTSYPSVFGVGYLESVIGPQEGAQFRRLSQGPRNNCGGGDARIPLGY